MPSSISSVAPSLPTRAARNGGTCGGAAARGSAPAASVAAAAARESLEPGRVETRRRAERPFADGVAEHDLVVDERACVDLAGCRGSLIVGREIDPSIATAAGSPSFTTMSSGPCHRTIAFFAAR